MSARADEGSSNEHGAGVRPSAETPTTLVADRAGARTGARRCRHPGWLGWEYWGTTWASHRTQARVINTLHHDWGLGKQTSLVPEGPGGRLVAAQAIVRI